MSVCDPQISFGSSMCTAFSSCEVFVQIKQCVMAGFPGSSAKGVCVSQSNLDFNVEKLKRNLMETKAREFSTVVLTEYIFKLSPLLFAATSRNWKLKYFLAATQRSESDVSDDSRRADGHQTHVRRSQLTDGKLLLAGIRTGFQ